MIIKTIKAENGFYTLVYGITLTTLQPVDVKLVKDDSDHTMPKGAEITLLYTDNETYVAARMEDGRECKIFVDRSEYPYTVNGVPDYECFDGMMFAG